MTTLGFVSLSAYGLFAPETARKFGGSEVQVARLCRALAARGGLRVALITSGEGAYRQREVDGVELRKLAWNPAGGRLDRALLAWRLRREIARLGPDLYVQRCLGLETGLVGAWCKRRGTPFIYMTASDWDCDRTYDRQRPAWMTRYSHRGMRAADLILTQSERHRALLSANYGLDSAVLPSLCDLPEAAPWPRTHWLWVGRCEASKQPQLFLELAARFPAERFTLIAPPANDPRLFEEIRSRAETQPNLRFLPGVPYHEIDAFYRAAKGLINTSEQEGFPNVFLEAAKHGVPILSLCVNPDDFLDRFALGEAMRGSFEAMQKRLAEWTRATDDLCAMGRRGRSYVAEHHGVEMVAERFLAHVDRLLRDRKVK